MFKSLLTKANHRVLRINKGDTHGAPVLHLIIMPPFYHPKCVPTLMSILCKLDFYGLCARLAHTQVVIHSDRLPVMYKKRLVSRINPKLLMKNIL